MSSSGPVVTMLEGNKRQPGTHLPPVSLAGESVVTTEMVTPLTGH